MSKVSIGEGSERLTEAKQGYVRGKPVRKVDNSIVSYPLSLTNIQFRLDSVSAAISQRYGIRFSRYQFKVFMAVCELLPMLGVASVSYHQVDKSGMVRGMNWEQIARSLVVMHECGVLEVFGATQGDKHFKYRLSREGDELWAWINSELCCPRDILLVNSKRFAQPVLGDKQV